MVSQEKIKEITRECFAITQEYIKRNNLQYTAELEESQYGAPCGEANLIVHCIDRYGQTVMDYYLQNDTVSYNPDPDDDWYDNSFDYDTDSLFMFITEYGKSGEFDSRAEISMRYLRQQVEEILDDGLM